MDQNNQPGRFAALALLLLLTVLPAGLAGCSGGDAQTGSVQRSEEQSSAPATPSVTSPAASPSVRDGRALPPAASGPVAEEPSGGVGWGWMLAVDAFVLVAVVFVMVIGHALMGARLREEERRRRRLENDLHGVVKDLSARVEALETRVQAQETRHPDDR